MFQGGNDRYRQMLLLPSLKQIRMDSTPTFAILVLQLPKQDHSLVCITNVLVPFANGHTPIHVNALLLLDCLLFLMYKKESPNHLVLYLRL